MVKRRNGELQARKRNDVEVHEWIPFLISVFLSVPRSVGPQRLQRRIKFNTAAPPVRHNDARLQAQHPVSQLGLAAQVGGNQQRALLALLPPALKVLAMEHPTRGLDVESAQYIWDKLLRRRAEGTAILYATADLDELLRYSDRVLVFFAGEITAELRASAATVEQLGALIGGKQL